MFNYFKRPIVINFTVEQIHPDSKLSIIKTTKPVSIEVVEAVARAWKETGVQQKAVVVGEDFKIENLTDDDLKRIGLMRIKTDA